MVHPQYVHEAMRTAEAAGQQARWLTPTKWLALGALVAVLGVGLWFDERGRALPFVPWLLLLAGIAIVFAARRALRAERQRDEQLAQLDARWTELEAGMREAIAGGHSPVRYLQGAGVTLFEVRQVALRRLRGEPDGKVPVVRDVAATGPSAAYVPKAARPRPPEPPAPHWLPRG